MTTMLGWIRPWYPGAAGDHVRADCPVLAAETSTPQEGSGWLNPSDGAVCETCLPPWDATCTTCGASMSVDLLVDEPFSEAKATQWKTSHTCRPNVRLVPPPREDEPATPAQPALFDLQDAAA